MNAKEQATENLLKWARETVEESRARYGYGTDDPSDIQPPSWLPELEAACEAVEAAS